MIERIAIERILIDTGLRCSIVYREPEQPEQGCIQIIEIREGDEIICTCSSIEDVKEARRVFLKKKIKVAC